MQSPATNILRARALTDAGFRHGFPTREGGLDFRAGDVRVASERRLGSEVGFAPEALYQTKQVHGARVVRVQPGSSPDATWQEEADALVTSAGAVGVRVADCVPVLVADPATGGVAAIHAGWRGIVAGVIAAGLRDLGVATHRLIAAIGPCIGACCFEVGDDVARQIVAACGDEGVRALESRVTSGPNGDRRLENKGNAAKAHVDLRAAVRAQLRGLGVNEARIEDVDGCTLCDQDARFHSFRRDGESSGRHLAVIVAR